jgi:hypothetical protein
MSAIDFSSRVSSTTRLVNDRELYRQRNMSISTYRGMDHLMIGTIPSMSSS